jgi:hypothetical protein
MIPQPCRCGQDGYRLVCARGGPGLTLKYAVECPRCGRRGPWSDTDPGAVSAWNGDRCLTPRVEPGTGKE